MRRQRSPSLRTIRSIVATCVLIASSTSFAADQTSPGAGNETAIHLAGRSPLVESAIAYLIGQAGRIHDRALKAATLDILENPATCVMHRRGLGSNVAQDAVIAKLFEEGLINQADADAFPAGVRAAVFPPILQATSDCPRLPQPFRSAPGSVFGGHHSYPGGLAVHESNNERSDVHLASQYEAVYGNLAADRLPRIDTSHAGAPGRHGDLPIDEDVILAAPIWHDWAKTIVFQWNADGSEFTEFNFGGAGTNDAWGAAGDSRTAAHHLLSIAESMALGLSPLMVITQASAHAAPTLGNEFKVVNWLRAAAIIARIDVVKSGYLAVDDQGQLRLPAIGRLGDVDLNAAGQTNLRVEYALHNLSDADFTFSGPAITDVTVLLKTLAPEFGYDAMDIATFNNRFRNPALAYLSGERLLTLYGSLGLDAVRQQMRRLHERGIL